MAERKITQQQITDCIKFLTELGGLYRVDDEYFIIKPNDKPVMCKSKGRKQESQPVKIYHPNAMMGDFKLLNPFVEDATTNSERTWFWNHKSNVLGSCLKHTFRKICEIATGEQDEEDEEPEVAEYVSKFSGQIDNKTWENFKSFKPDVFLSMVYNRKEKKAYLRSQIQEQEFREENKRIRKKDWTVLDNVLAEIGLVKMEDFQYQSSAVGYSEAEARLNVLAMAAEVLSPWTKILLNTDLKPGEILYWIGYLPEIYKASLWFSSPSAKEEMDATKEEEEEDEPPWRTKLPNAQQQQQAAASQGYGQMPQPQGEKFGPVRSDRNRMQQQQMIPANMPQMQGGYPQQMMGGYQPQQPMAPQMQGGYQPPMNMQMPAAGYPPQMQQPMGGMGGFQQQPMPPIQQPPGGGYYNRGMAPPPPGNSAATSDPPPITLKNK